MVTQTQTRARSSSVQAEGAKVSTAPKHDETNVKLDLLSLAKPGARLASKAVLLSEAAQTFSEVHALQNDNAAAERIAELSGRAANKLFEGQVAGIISPEEVTELLGNQFGWRKKGDAKARAETIADQSKTPFGYGETVRKRITRAVKAQAFAKGAEPDNFFSKLEPATVEEMLTELREDGGSIFTLYDNLDDERKAATANDDKPVDANYNPAKVRRIVAKLNEVGSLDVFASNPSLIIAWASVVEAVENITTELMKRPDAAEIIAAVQGAAPSSEVAE